jgi:hypothetical protein
MEERSAEKRVYVGKLMMSKVLGAFGLLYFNILRLVLAWSAF